MDLDDIISASQTLSSETDLQQLLIKMMELVMANSGAERAVLLLRQEEDWFVQARGDITAEKHDILLNQPFDPADFSTNLSIRLKGIVRPSSFPSVSLIIAGGQKSCWLWGMPNWIIVLPKTG